jgi:hypothetical protein
VTTVERVDEMIAAVRAAADDPRGAYLIRSRLRRSILACTRAVAEREGLPKPVLAGQWVTATDKQAQDVVDLCRRVYDRAQVLCQPSESFDVRWEAGWRDLQTDLVELETAFTVFAAS